MVSVVVGDVVDRAVAAPFSHKVTVIETPPVTTFNALKIVPLRKVIETVEAVVIPGLLAKIPLMGKYCVNAGIAP